MHFDNRIVHPSDTFPELRVKPWAVPVGALWLRRSERESLYSCSFRVDFRVFSLRRAFGPNKTYKHSALSGKRILRRKKPGFCTRKHMKNERRLCRIPRMSKKRKEEWALFLNDRNRITYNKLCVQCEHECKQSFRAAVIYCPKYSKKEKVNGRIKDHQSK